MNDQFDIFMLKSAHLLFYNIWDYFEDNKNSRTGATKKQKKNHQPDE